MKQRKKIFGIWLLLSFVLMGLSALWTFHPKMVVTRALIQMFTPADISVREALDMTSFIDRAGDTFSYEGVSYIGDSQNKNFLFHGGMSQAKEFFFEGTKNEVDLFCSLTQNQILFALDNHFYFWNLEQDWKNTYEKSALATVLDLGSKISMVDLSLEQLPVDEISLNWFQRETFDFFHCIKELLEIVLATDVTTQMAVYEPVSATKEASVKATAYHLAMSAEDVATIMNMFEADAIWTQLVGSCLKDADGILYVKEYSAKPIALTMEVTDIRNTIWDVVIEFEDVSQEPLCSGKQYEIYIHRKEWAEEDLIYWSYGYQCSRKEQQLTENHTIAISIGDFFKLPTIRLSHEFDCCKLESVIYADIGEDGYQLEVSYSSEEKEKGIRYRTKQDQKILWTGNFSLQVSYAEKWKEWQEEKAVDILTPNKLLYLMEMKHILQSIEKII